MSSPLASPPAAAAAAAATGRDDDDDSFSSDSDDEFLTMREDGKVDRESLIRKKLLESFYGKSTVEGQDNDNNEGNDDDDSFDSDDDNNNSNKKASSKFQGRHPPLRGAYDDADEADVNAGSSARRGGGRHRSSQGVAHPGLSEDLDSPHFNAARHTERYVLKSGVHPLLETEESLACQVRTLDSSMQTLVYENYSRFIEATDAIRSIGVNVQANATNLQKLSTSIGVVADSARNIETACGALRDSVVEKIRVKRLLQRLEALLKLPSTLRENIDGGKYRWATKSYLTAYAILNKHSAGFESLQRIESECHDIMDAMLVDVKRKLLHWSGNFVMSGDSDENNDDVSDGDKDAGQEGNFDTMTEARSSGLLEDPPDPPQTVAEIFECAGTPVLVLDHQRQKPAAAVGTSVDRSDQTLLRPATMSRKTSMVEFDTGLSTEECSEMALNACLRLLERFLDTHHIELQEALLAAEGGEDGVGGGGGPSDRILDTATLAVPNLSNPPGTMASQSSLSIGKPGKAPSSKLIPTHVLDSILEASALFSMTFPARDGENSTQLAHFVSMAFYSFLQHVRTELLEQAMQAYPKDLKKIISGDDDDDDDNEVEERRPNLALSRTRNIRKNQDSADDENADEDEQQDSYEKAYEDIANATSLLMESVQQFASGLALPEVAIDISLAASLVDQTVGLTEGMVRRRVDQKFFTLRFRVIEDCLAPFCRSALLGLQKSGEQLETNKPDDVEDSTRSADRIVLLVQMASVALSDSLVLVDDTIRSILSNTVDDSSDSGSSPSGGNARMLKAAVEQSTQRFASWMATAMESLAGCESSEPKHIVDVMTETTGKGGPEVFTRTEAATNQVASSLTQPQSSFGDDENEISALVEDRMTKLLDELSTLGTDRSKSYLTLAIADMCREAERTFMDDINQAIATHTGGNMNKQRTSKVGLFATSASGLGGEDVSSPASKRFHLAASRVLSFYAINRGSEAGDAFCAGLMDLSDDVEDGEMSGPRSGVISLLAVAKESSLDCADLFGGPKCAGPLPENLEDEYTPYNTGSRQQTARSGLAFDVERMFAEKVVVYPLPFDSMEFKRNSVVSLAMKVALKAVIEDSRIVRFSVRGYRQFLVDIEFLKFILPHYISDELLPDGSNPQTVVESLLTEAVKSAKERCDSSALLQDDSVEVNEARAVVRDFMASNSDTSSTTEGLVYRFTIQDV